jgi:hypothetical protein
MPQRLATVAEVLAVACEFSETPEPVVQMWMEIAADMIGVSRWGDRASRGHALLSAHLLAVNVGPDGLGGIEAGPLTAEADGPASRSFAAPPITDASIETTNYGRTYMALRRTVTGRGTGIVINRNVRQS